MSQRATVTTTDGITLITMPNVPADIDFVAKIFENIASLGINVDMISLTPPQGANIDLSFTISDDDLGKLLAYNAARANQAYSQWYPAGTVRFLFATKLWKLLLAWLPRYFELPQRPAQIFGSLLLQRYKLLY